MKKPLLIIGIVIALVLCTGSIAIVALGSFAWSGFDSWDQAKEPWLEITLPVPNYSGKVVFSAQSAHPFLAEYNYKVKIDNKEYGLQPNTGGRVWVDASVITYQGNTYLMIRGTLIDLKKNEEVKKFTQGGRIDSTAPVIYDEILPFGTWQSLGTIQRDKSKLVLNAITTEPISLSKNTTWTAWRDLPQAQGRVRFGSEGPQAYIEIQNAANASRIFPINTVSITERKTLFFITYKDRHFISMNKTADQSFALENLVDLGSGEAILSMKDGKESISYWNPFIKDMIEKGSKVSLFDITVTQGQVALVN